MRMYRRLSLLAAASWLLVGCNQLEEKQAEKTITAYYEAIQQLDEEAAFALVWPYDDTTAQQGHYTEGTTLQQHEAKEVYIEKMNKLTDEAYALKDFEIIDVEYEDGHSFWHHVKLHVAHQGQLFEWHEVVDIYDGKVVIGETDDPLAMYRDGALQRDGLE